MERLNNNEVKEVARMQSLINGYEAFIKALWMLKKGKDNITYPIFVDSPHAKIENDLWKWVKEHKDKE